MTTARRRKRPARRPPHDYALSPGAARSLAQSITDALDPVKVPGRVRSFADMSPEEQAEMRKRYEGSEQTP